MSSPICLHSSENPGCGTTPGCCSRSESICFGLIVRAIAAAPAANATFADIANQMLTIAHGRQAGTVPKLIGTEPIHGAGRWSSRPSYPAHG